MRRTFDSENDPSFAPAQRRLRPGDAFSPIAHASSRYTGRLAPWQEQRVHAFIEENLEQRLMCRDLAILVKISVSHFSRMFRGSFGLAPTAYIQQRRVRQAQLLLASTTTPVAVVAFQCGFADQAHMSRVFAMITGRPPAAWRRAQRAAQADVRALHLGAPSR